MWIGEGRDLLDKAEDKLRGQGLNNIETVLREAVVEIQPNSLRYNSF